MNLSMIRGDTLVLRVTLEQAGAPVTLTDYVAIFSAKRAYTDADGDRVFQCSVGDGIVFTSPSTGVLTVTVVPEKTESLPAYETQLVYDLQMVKAGVVSTPLYGKLTVKPDVSVGLTPSVPD